MLPREVIWNLKHSGKTDWRNPDIWMGFYVILLTFGGQIQLALRLQAHGAANPRQEIQKILKDFPDKRIAMGYGDKDDYGTPDLYRIFYSDHKGQPHELCDSKSFVQHKNPFRQELCGSKNPTTCFLSHLEGYPFLQRYSMVLKSKRNLMSATKNCKNEISSKFGRESHLSKPTLLRTK